MADRFDDGRDGLSGAEPTRDLWAEAQGRATQETVPLSTVPAARRRHPARWLAAAVAALLVGVGLAVVTDDDPGVTAGPQGTTALTAPSPTYGAGTACPFTVTGEQPQLRTGHISGGVFDVPGAEADGATTVMHGLLGGQPMEISIPGQMVTDLVGERVEDIELERGTGQIWFGDGFAQVRWFPGTERPCDSFTVTVAGDNEDFNRHAAVDFADRVVLPSYDITPVTGLIGTWRLAEVTADGVTTPADGELFTFSADQATWETGCNGKKAGAHYEAATGGSLIRLLNTIQYATCSDAVSPVVLRVMTSAAPIAWKLSDDQLVLHANDATLVLDPVSPDGVTSTTIGDTTTTTSETSTTSTAPADGTTTFPIEGSWEVYSVAGAGSTDPSFPQNLEVIFGGTSIKWEDGCNEHLGTVHRVDGHTFTVQNPRVEAPKPCPNNPDASTLETVLGQGTPVGASLEGAAGSIYLTLQAPSGDQVVLRRANDGSSPSGDAPLG